MKKFLVIILLCWGAVAQAQLLSTDVKFPADNATIEIFFNANFGNGALAGHPTGDVYVHSGVITNLSATPTSWRYVLPGGFNEASPAKRCEHVSGNIWKFRVTNIRSFYGVPGSETIRKISILFRSGDGSKVHRNRDGSDMYIDVYPAGALKVRIDEPFRQPTFVPKSEPIIKSIGETVPITAVSNASSDLRILFNGNELDQSSSATSLSSVATIVGGGRQEIIAEATVGGEVVRDTVVFFVSSPTQTAPLPAGVSDGINYNAAQNAATLVLFAPNKTNVVVTGDFNNWTPTVAYQMFRTPDNQRYWITLNGLTPGQEYAYQYIIDDTLIVADYNAEKVLDPWNDPFVNEAPYTNRYPNLKPYPVGKASGIVSVLEPGKATYTWQNTQFQRPDKRNLMIYELLVRDFGAQADFQMMIDTLPYLARLGINCIHVMPFNEFEGNNSWGYNPSYMFAVDKFYGPENKLRAFIDSCHGRGIAVVMDMVLNHQFGQSPMVQMYWNAQQGKPATNSPWFNPDARHPFNVGFDMNHESAATAAFVERVMQHWLTKYKLDGFRWDLSKGFTQTNNPNDVGAWNAFDQSRVNIWERIYNQSQVISPNSYMILEHLGVDKEEAAMANMGMLFWGKMTEEFNENSMGYTGEGKDNFARAFHTNRWSDDNASTTPHLIAYAESHDEERLAYKNVNFGNLENSTYNTRSVNKSSKRLAAVNAFLYTIPGPKMLWQFGELGYDSSINMCGNLQNNSNCRVDKKPPAWAMPGGNYNLDIDRALLRDRTAKIISLRTKFPQYLSTFTGSDVDFSLSSAVKWQYMRGPNLTVFTVGNFGVRGNSFVSIPFPAAGQWYIYQTNLEPVNGNNPPVFANGDGANFSDVNSNLTAQGILIQPGALTVSMRIPQGTFFVFTNVDLNAVVTQFTFTGNGAWSNPANWANAAVPPQVLPSGSTITIQTPTNGECVLDIAQTLSAGSTLQVATGARLRITGNLTQQ